MQFKTPVFQNHGRAKYYTQFRGSYFEVGFTKHQQNVLLKLEERVTDLAVVRYASPAFWSRLDFDQYDEKRTVLANSAFVAPAKVKSHQKWMYAGVKGKVVLNPDPEETDPDNWDTVIGMLEFLAIRQSLRQHIRSLALALGGIVGTPATADNTAWIRRIQRYGSLSEDDAGLVTDLSRVAQAADEAAATWLVLLLPDDEWRDALRNRRGLGWPMLLWSLMMGY
ncbi:MAG TPA: hypothetical protein VG826_34795 [Pirellulales bacterium]|nr:hypothetical protein [Pirellulales bacterium]